MLFLPLWVRVLTLPTTIVLFALDKGYSYTYNALGYTWSRYGMALLIMALLLVSASIIHDFLQEAFFAPPVRIRGEAVCASPAIFYENRVIFRRVTIKTSSTTVSYRRLRCSTAHGRHLAENLEEGVSGVFYVTADGIFRPARLWALSDNAREISFPPEKPSSGITLNSVFAMLLIAPLLAAAGTIVVGLLGRFSLGVGAIASSLAFSLKAFMAYEGRFWTAPIIYLLCFGVWLAFRHHGEKRALRLVERDWGER